ncbi:hypothetical protein ABZ504_21035 [Streptomyces mirabilis]|uniref:hypothetical protein n=1 Tax=Streptomyces mirabilis TaxID=68239 RepID=UPI0033C523E3
MPEGKGPISPLFERLLTMGFAHMAPGRPVAVLTTTSEEDQPRFELPSSWRAAQGASRQELSVSATRLLAQGPLLLVPPWQRHTGTGGRAKRNASHFAYDEVLGACRPANADSVLVVLTPAELWTSESPRAAQLRATLADHWDTLAVLYGTGVIPQIHQSVIVAAAFLKARQTSRPPMKIFRVPHTDEGASVEKDFEVLLQRGGGSTRWGYVVRQLPPTEESLDFDRHHPDVVSQRADLAGFGSLTTLGELYEVVPRINMAADSKWISTEEQPGAVRLLGGRDVLRGGSIALPADESYWVKAPPGCLLQSGDLIVREIHGWNDPPGLIVAEVTEQDLPAAPAHTTIALRSCCLFGCDRCVSAGRG